MKYFWRLIILLPLFYSCSSKTTKEQPKAPKYIFYFIGDGFGYNQAHLAEGYLASEKGNIAPTPLFMNTFPVQGTYTTFAENRFITGSAAAGTALSSGHKTTINTVCMNGDHSKAYVSLAEMLRDRKKKIGIVTSVSIDHATPAVFYAHQPYRNNYYDVSVELPKSNFNYFAGGGFKDPVGKKKINALANMGIEQKHDTTSKQSKISAFKLAEQAGYTFINTKTAFNSLKNGDDKIIVFEPKPSSGSALPYVIDQTPENFTLMDFTRKGIELLDNPNGFFMMVEGGKIDWACHSNDVGSAIHEVLQFDNSVKVAYDFYKKHPKETLIVICSDHETGGLTLGYAMSHYETSIDLLDYQKISGEKFAKILTKLKNDKNGNLKYEEVYPLLKKYFGFDTTPELQLTKYEITDLKKAVHDFNTNTISEQIKQPLLECAYGPYNPIATIATRILAHKAGIDWTTYSHTASPCPARAIGIGSKRFYGYYDNTDIPRKIMDLFSLSPSDK